MGLRIVVVGIAGVGKSTVVEKSVEADPGLLPRRLRDRHVRRGQEAASGSKHRDEMRKLPVEKQKRLQKIAAQGISRGRGKSKPDLQRRATKGIVRSGRSATFPAGRSEPLTPACLGRPPQMRFCRVIEARDPRYA